MEDEERLKRTVRFNFGVQDMEKYKAKLKADGKDLGFLEEGDLDEGELRRFQERAAGWPYMLDMNDPKYAVARYATTLTKPLLMPDGKLHGFDSKTACQSLEAILIDSIVKKDDPKVYTHVDMAGEKGGKFYIATSEEEAERLGRKAWCTEKQFLRLYALATLHGHKTWLIEQHTLLDPLDSAKGNKMVYFMDLDINQPEIIKPQTIEVLVFIIVRALRKFFPGAQPDLFHCICATTVSKIDRCQGCLCTSCSSKEPSKLCETCKGVGNTGLSQSGHACGACGGTYPVKKKTGLHLHFPRIVVTTGQALDIRQTMIAESKRLWGVRAPPFNDWEDVFDGSVYKKAGLRMLGANKGEICKACKSSKTGKLEDCKECGNRRKIDQGRPYFPLACFGNGGYRDKELEARYEADFCALVEDVSIRAGSKRDLTEGYVLYEGAPTDITSIRQGKKRSRAEVGEAKEHGSSGQGVPMLAQDAPEMAAIQSFFSDKNVQSQVCPEKYGQLVVSQVKMRQTGGIKYKVDVTGANSRYCMNKGDYHGGNRVYFEFRAASKDCAQGVVQRCYCEKAEVRKYGLCSTFVSRPLTIPDRIAQVLFPAPAEKAGSSRHSHFSGGEGGSVLSRLDPRTMSAASRSQSQMILTAGNLLVRELFGPQQNWTTSARFQGMYGRALLQTPMPRKDKDPHPLFRQVRMDNLGSQDKKLMISLGFMEEEPQALELKKLKVTPSIKQLQTKLSKTVRDILSVVLHSDEPKALKVLKTSGGFSLLKDLVL